MQELSTLAELAPQIAVAIAIVGLVFVLRRGDIQRLQELKKLLPNGSSEKRMLALEKNVSEIKVAIGEMAVHISYLHDEHKASNIRPGDAE